MVVVNTETQLNMGQLRVSFFIFAMNDFRNGQALLFFFFFLPLKIFFLPQFRKLPGQTFP